MLFVLLQMSFQTCPNQEDPEVLCSIQGHAVVQHKGFALGKWTRTCSLACLVLKQSCGTYQAVLATVSNNPSKDERDGPMERLGAGCHLHAGSATSDHSAKSTGDLQEPQTGHKAAGLMTLFAQRFCHEAEH